MKPRFQTIDTDQFIDGQIPVYDEDNRQFRAASRNSDGGASELNDLDDVLISDPQDGEVLSYDNGEWKNTVISGGGAVDSVNGQTGVVVLNYSDVGAPKASDLTDHTSNTSNPHGVTKTQVGLGNVTNDAQLKASQLDTDTTLSADSDARVPSQKAVKAYVDANSGGGVGGSVTSVTASLPLESSGGNAPNISLKKPTGNAGSDEAVFGDDTRLSDSRTPTGGAGGVLSGSYPNPGFAVDMATQDELDNAITQRGIPAGGSTGQVLAKQSGSNYAVGWVDQSGGGGGGGGHVISVDGTPLPQRGTLEFIGATGSDDAGNDTTKIEITGGGGGSAPAVPYPEPKAAYGRYLMGAGEWLTPSGITGDNVADVLWIPDYGAVVTVGNSICVSYDGQAFTEKSSPRSGYGDGSIHHPDIGLIQAGAPARVCRDGGFSTWNNISIGDSYLSSHSFFYGQSSGVLVGIFSVSGQNTIYYSEDGGSSWDRGADTNYRHFYSDAPGGVIIYRISNMFLEKSVDYGATWEQSTAYLAGDAAGTDIASYDPRTDTFCIPREGRQAIFRKGFNGEDVVTSRANGGSIHFIPEINVWLCGGSFGYEYSIDRKTWHVETSTPYSMPWVYCNDLGVILSRRNLDSTPQASRVRTSISAHSNFPFIQPEP